MRFALLTYGSRGDLQPYIALGLALQRAGHEVILAAPARYEGFVNDYGINEFAALPGDPTQLMEQIFSRKGLRWGALSLAQAVFSSVAPYVHELYPALIAVCQSADVIVHSLLLTGLGHQAAVHLHKPDFSALVFPLFAPTREFPCPLFPAAKTKAFLPFYHSLSHREFSRVFWQINRLGLLALRINNKAAPKLEDWPFSRFDARYYPHSTRSTWQTPILYGISSHVLPYPADWPCSSVHLTGYWPLPASQDWQPPADLLHFLSNGPAPVCVTFGSTVSPSAAQIAQRIVETLVQAGQRVVWAQGWLTNQCRMENTEINHQNVFQTASVPFGWLLPQMSGMIYHGGMGSTMDGLRAGIPLLAIPFGADQPFWARRITTLGAGIQIPPSTLKNYNLRGTISSWLIDDSYKQKAQRLSQKILIEDGPVQAVHLMEEHLKHFGMDLCPEIKESA